MNPPHVSARPRVNIQRSPRDNHPQPAVEALPSPVQEEVTTSTTPAKQSTETTNGEVPVSMLAGLVNQVLEILYNVEAGLANN